MQAARVLSTICLCCAATTACADATYFTADSALTYDSNVGRSQQSKDIDDDFGIEAGLTAAHSLRLNDKSGLVFRAGAQVAEQFHHTDLSQLTLDGSVRYRIQPVVGFTNPWIELMLEGARLQYRDSDIRDSWVWTTGATVGKYFTDRIRLTAGWNYELRRADDGQVFDWHHNTFALTADYRFTQKGTLYGSAARVYGDQVSTVSFPGSATLYENVSKADDRDKALEDNANNPKRAYRLAAITNVFEIGVNYAVKGDLALDLGVQRYNSSADGGHSYNGTIARAGLLYRF